LKGTIIEKARFRSLFTGLMPLFILAHCGHHLLTALPVPLLPMIRSEFALDYTQAGWVVSAFGLSYGIGHLPAGWLADRIGRRIFLTLGLCGVAVAGLVVGLSQTYIMMLIFLALMGLLGGGYHPSAPPMISEAVEPEDRGTALGVHFVGGSASYFLAPLIAAAIAVAWGWRGPFITLAVPTVILGIIFYILLGRLPKRSLPETTVTSSSRQETPDSSRIYHLVWLIILSTFASAVAFSTTAFIPLYLVDHFGVAEDTAARFVAIVYSAGVWASPLGGYLSDRFGTVPVIIGSCFAAAPLVYLLNLVPFGVAIGAVLLIFGMTTYFRMPSSEAYIVSHTSERNRSTVLGIYFFCAIEGGGVLTPLMGALIDRLGFHTSFSIAAAAIFVVSIICSIGLRSRRA
jgi:MFS family permease